MEHLFNKKNNCPICDNESAVDFISATDHNVSNDVFNITACNSCGLKFTNPKISEETIGKYYKSDNYISHSNTKKGLINKLYHLVRKYQFKQKEKLISKLSNEKKLLDIGCGTGEFLKYCKQKNWLVSGLEPDELARSFASKNYNLDLYNNLNEINNKKFDVVTMWHSLEHVYHLKNDFLKISNLLNNKGYLIIAVPNCASYDAKYYKNNWAAYDLPIHLYHFNKKNIADLAEMFGLNVIKIKPLIFDAFYISMLSEKKKEGSALKGFFVGLWSNIKAKKTTNHSSLIYILQKK